MHTNWRSQRGQAFTEMILALPVATLAVCMVLQLSLDYNAKSVVEYAAYNAARTAIVHIAEDSEDEAANSVDTSGAKMKAIQRAAALSILPIAPWDDSLMGVVESLQEPSLYVASAFTSQEEDTYGSRFGWANSHTRVYFETYSGSGYKTMAATNGAYSFGQGGDDDIIVHVEYDHYQAFPVWGLFYFLGWKKDLRTVTINARVVLPLEGETVRARL